MAHAVRDRRRLGDGTVATDREILPKTVALRLMASRLVRSLQHRFGFGQMAEHQMAPRDRQNDPGIGRGKDECLFGHGHRGLVLNAAEHQAHEDQAQMDRGRA